MRPSEPAGPSRHDGAPLELWTRVAGSTAMYIYGHCGTPEEAALEQSRGLPESHKFLGPNRHAAVQHGAVQLPQLPCLGLGGRPGPGPAWSVGGGGAPSYSGTYNAAYGQDLFLGIPYAQPPTGDLRFRPPQPLNATWTGVRNATEYSPQCFGYGSDTWVLGNYVSEDCLTVNVVRPHGVKPDAKLPVALWIHGGDPEQVTIWGESAGARGVSAQILAYGGRDDKLFRVQKQGREPDSSSIVNFGMKTVIHINRRIINQHF